MNQRIATALLFGALMSATPASMAASSLQPFEVDTMQKIAEQHKGRPYVVLVWSMDCEFCQASLDVLTRMRRDGQHFDIVTISTDALADRPLAAATEQRLASLELGENAWAFGAQPPERLRFAIDRGWHGEKPRSYWYRADGQVSRHSGVIKPAMIGKLNASATTPR